MIETNADLRNILSRITFGPSGVMLDRMALRWEIESISVAVETFEPAWRIRFNFLRPDAETGAVGCGTGRWELVEHGASESSVVKTAWLLLELLMRHELMEAFRFDGVALFDPHRTVEQLKGGAS